MKARHPFLRALLALWLLIPLLVLLNQWWNSRDLTSQANGDPQLQQQIQQQLQQEFSERLKSARQISDHALEHSPWSTSDLLTTPWLKTMEGVGLWHGQPAYYQWQGSPPPPVSDSEGNPKAGIRLQQDGNIVRLSVTTPANLLGFRSIAGFKFGAADQLHQSPWLPQPPAGEWQSVRLAHQAAASDQEWGLNDLEGNTLLWVQQVPTPQLVTQRELRRTIRAWLTVVWLGLSFVLWRFYFQFSSIHRPLIEAVLILLGRQLLEWGRISDTLFPGSLGGASWFGSTALGHWLDAPLDLLWTAIALAWASERLREWSSRLPQIVGTLTKLIVATLLALSFFYLPSLLATDTPLDVLDWDDAKPRLVAACLWLAWAIHGVSTALAVVHLFKRERPLPKRWVVLVLAVGTFLGATLYEQALERDALQRVQSRIVPQLAQPTEDRIWVLEQTLQSIVQNEDPESIEAFQVWRDSELGRTGYQSSLEILDPEGNRHDYFSRGLGDFEDPALDFMTETRFETLDEGTRVREVIHSEASWQSDEEEPAWTIVGHVLESPDNLPFINEETDFYKATMPVESAARANVSYVLYNRRGVVLTQTLDRAPPYSRELDLAATQNQELKLIVGPDRYRALPLLDQDQVHLLLLRQRSTIGRAARALRLTIAALFVLLIVSVLTPSSYRYRNEGHTLWSGSFYKKLLTTVLAASIPPLLGLVFLVQGFLERRAETEFVQAGVQAVVTAQRGIESLLTIDASQAELEPLDDVVLSWLSRLAGRPIHVWRDGQIEASSEREWFNSGIHPPQLPGKVHEDITLGGAPYALHDMTLGGRTIPLAFAPLRSSLDGERIVGVPLDATRQAADRTTDKVGEAMLLATAGLLTLLTFAAATLARMVSRPVRTLVTASGRLAAGDYSARASSPSRDELGELVTSFNVMASALQEQRADLEQRRDYIETLLTHATTGIASLDSEQRIVTANPALHRILDLDPGALKPGEDWSSQLAANGVDGSLHARLSHAAEPWLDATEVDLQRGSEGQRLRIVQIKLPTSSGENSRLILVDDLTDLMRSNQLEAWAEMARAIAHEIKNPLTPIQLSTEHLKKRLMDRGVLPAEDLDRCLDTVLKQVEALREIASEFNTYAKLPALNLKPVQAVQVFEQAVSPYRQSPPTGISMVSEHANPEGLILVDEKAFIRALMNLIENAIQAMPEGGTLTCALRHVEKSSGHKPVFQFIVQDTGVGIDDQTRARLYEPYFSTKSSGTGLGLAIVRRTIEAHQGTITVESEPGKGATFTISLPQHRS